MINIPKRKYTKKEMCMLLRDPENFINNNLSNIPYSASHNRQLKRDILKAGLLKKMGITENEYDRIKTFTITQGELIIQAII